MKINKTILFGAIIGMFYGLGGILVHLLPKPLILFFGPAYVFFMIVALVTNALLTPFVSIYLIMLIIWIITLLCFSMIGLILGKFIFSIRKRRKNKNEL